MLQFILAAFVALCAQFPPSDEQVVAALPRTEALRTDVCVVKNRVTGAGESRGAQWQCIAYFTETTGDVAIRRVYVVYLETGGK